MPVSSMGWIILSHTHIHAKCLWHDDKAISKETWKTSWYKQIQLSNIICLSIFSKMKYVCPKKNTGHIVELYKNHMSVLWHHDKVNFKNKESACMKQNHGSDKFSLA